MLSYSQFSRLKKKSLTLLYLVYPEICVKTLEDIRYNKLSKCILKLNLKFCFEENTINPEVGNITCITKLSQTQIAIASDKHFRDIFLWDLLNNCCYKTLKYKHTGLVTCLTKLSHNKLASGCTNGILVIWELNEGTCLTCFQCDYNEVLFCISKINNKEIISGSSRMIELRNYLSFENDDFYLKEAFSLVKINQNQVAFGSSNGLISIIDFLSKDRVFLDKEIRILNDNVHTKDVICLIKLSKNLIASGSSDFLIKIWDLVDGKCLNTLNGHLGAVRCLTKISREIIASGSFDQTIKIWEIKNGICIKTLYTQNTVKFLISYIRTKLLTVDDLLIRIWDL